MGAERGIAGLGIRWRYRRFVGIELDEYTPDHWTISRARLIDLDTHREVFSWVLGGWPIADC